MLKDWRKCSQDLIDLPLPYEGVHYVHAQAWNLKGYLGAKHSYLVVNKSECPIVIELTDRETLMCQDSLVLFEQDSQADDQTIMPFVTTRSYNAQWFGHDPKLIASTPKDVQIRNIVTACSDYPFEYGLYTRNCNTFVSYMNWRLGLGFDLPPLAIGSRSPCWWENYFAQGIDI